MRRLAALLLALPLIACAGAPEPAPREKTDLLGSWSGARDLPIFVETDVIGKVKVGTLTLRDEVEGGKMFLQLPGLLGRCSGPYRTDGAPARAQFQVFCANGDSAEGAFERTGPAAGFGAWTDAAGRRVAFTFGGP